MNSRHPDPRRVLGRYRVAGHDTTSGIPGISQACSKKLVLEQHSFTFADFVRAPPLGLLPVPVLSSEKLVWEQHSITFADFCCPRPPWGRCQCRC